MSSSATADACDLDISSFDVENYGSRYDGHTKVQRLGFLMDTFPKLKPVAARALLKELKNGCNVTAYMKVLCIVDEATRNELGCDEGVAHNITQNNQVKMELLEAELASAKSAVMKEGTRQAYNDIGHLWYQIGNLTEALKSYLRTRDLCSMARHNCEMALNVISVSIDLKQFFNVNNFVSKVTDVGGDDAVLAKLKVASAMADLYDQQYHSAATKFLEVNPILGNQFNTVASAEDIAIYASICALATFDRAELRTRLVDNKSFINSYLSLVPDFKAMVLGFCSGEYGTAFKLLDSVRPRLLGDIYLHANVTQLVHLISERMLLQYFTPYSAVDLGRMAASLQMDRATLDAAVVRLVSSGRLSARIDARNNTMHRRTSDLRHATLEKVCALSQVHAHAIKRDILRLSLMQQGFVIGDVDEGSGAGAGSSYRGSSSGAGHSHSSGPSGGAQGSYAEYSATQTDLDAAAASAFYNAEAEFMHGAASVADPSMAYGQGHGHSGHYGAGDAERGGDTAMMAGSDVESDHEDVDMDDYEMSRGGSSRGVASSMGAATARTGTDLSVAEVSVAGSQASMPDLDEMDDVYA